MIEIETKIRVDDHAAVQQRLSELDARFIGRYLEHNCILDLPDGRLRNAGSGLRLRTMQALEGVTAAATLTFKGPGQPGNLKRREEIELEIPDPDRMLTLLTAIGFKTVIQYAKRRERWTLDACHVELDEVPLLGRFVEIEGPDEKTIRQVQKRIGLSGQPHVVPGYVAMLDKRCTELNRSPIGITFES